MKISNFARLAGLLLVAGFFYSCGSTNPNVDQFIERNEYNRALNELDRLIQDSPEDPQLYIKRAEVTASIAQQSEPADRVDLYTDTVDDFNSATEYGASEIQVKTIDSLSQQLWKEEYNAGMRALDEDSVYNTSNRAIAHFVNAITLKPENISSYKNLALVQFNEGDIDGAISTFMESLNHLENPPVSIYENLGYLYLEKGDPAESIHYYELANKNVQDDLNLVYGLVNAYVADDKSEEAIELLEPLVEENPQNAKLRNVYGTQLYNFTSDILDELRSAYQTGDSVLVDELRAEAIGVGESAETNLIEAFRRDTLHTEYIESLAVFYNNLAGRYLSMSEVAFDTHKQELQEEALKLVDFAIEYYTKLEAIEPSNEEYQTRLDTLKNLKQNYSEQE